MISEFDLPHSLIHRSTHHPNSSHPSLTILSLKHSTVTWYQLCILLPFSSTHVMCLLLSVFLSLSLHQLSSLPAFVHLPFQSSSTSSSINIPDFLSCLFLSALLSPTAMCVSVCMCVLLGYPLHDLHNSQTKVNTGDKWDDRERMDGKGTKLLLCKEK